MMRSLFSAVSGLRNHMTYMDVISNNIANVNTIAFKASRVTFQDMFGADDCGPRPRPRTTSAELTRCRLGSV